MPRRMASLVGAFALAVLPLSARAAWDYEDHGPHRIEKQGSSQAVPVDPCRQAELERQLAQPRGEHSALARFRREWHLLRAKEHERMCKREGGSSSR